MFLLTKSEFLNAVILFHYQIVMESVSYIDPKCHCPSKPVLNSQSSNIVKCFPCTTASLIEEVMVKQVVVETGWLQTVQPNLLVLGRKKAKAGPVIRASGLILGQHFSNWGSRPNFWWDPQSLQ